MLIADYTHNDLSDWEDFVEKSPQSTIYHTIYWKQFWEGAFSHRAHYLVARDDRAKLVGVLPVFYLKNMFGKRLVSLPLRDRGGCLCCNDLVCREMISCLIELGKKLGVHYIEIKDGVGHAGVDGWCRDDVRVTEKEEWISSVVTLPDSEQEIWKGLANNATGPVRQAQKLGVVVEEKNSLEGTRDFARIFFHCRKRLAVPSYNQEFFDLMFKHLVPQGKAMILLAYYQNQAVAGMILLLHGQTVIDGYAASLDEHKHLRANDLLIWEALQWAVQKGYKRFDFGADSPRQQGLLAFKKKWGARQEPVATTIFQMSNRKPASLDSDEDKYGFARLCLKKMPRFLYKFASKEIIKRIG